MSQRCRRRFAARIVLLGLIWLGIGTTARAGVVTEVHDRSSIASQPMRDQATWEWVDHFAAAGAVDRVDARAIPVTNPASMEAFASSPGTQVSGQAGAALIPLPPAAWTGMAVLGWLFAAHTARRILHRA